VSASGSPQEPHSHSMRGDAECSAKPVQYLHGRLAGVRNHLRGETVGAAFPAKPKQGATRCLNDTDVFALWHADRRWVAVSGAGEGDEGVGAVRVIVMAGTILPDGPIIVSRVLSRLRDKGILKFHGLRA
jgi:hypothetical protein